MLSCGARDVLARTTPETVRQSRALMFSGYVFLSAYTCLAADLADDTTVQYRFPNATSAPPSPRFGSTHSIYTIRRRLYLTKTSSVSPRLRWTRAEVKVYERACGEYHNILRDG